MKMESFIFWRMCRKWKKHCTLVNNRSRFNVFEMDSVALLFITLMLISVLCWCKNNIKHSFMISLECCCLIPVFKRNLLRCSHTKYWWIMISINSVIFKVPNWRNSIRKEMENSVRIWVNIYQEIWPINTFHWGIDIFIVNWWFCDSNDMIISIFRQYSSFTLKVFKLSTTKIFRFMPLNRLFEA